MLFERGWCWRSLATHSKRTRKWAQCEAFLESFNHCEEGGLSATRSSWGARAGPKLPFGRNDSATVSKHSLAVVHKLLISRGPLHRYPLPILPTPEFTINVITCPQMSSPITPFTGSRRFCGNGEMRDVVATHTHELERHVFIFF